MTEPPGRTSARIALGTARRITAVAQPHLTVSDQFLAIQPAYIHGFPEL